MAGGMYVNKAVQAMYGIPLSQLTPKQRKILREDGKRRAKLIEEREKAVRRDNLKAFKDEAQFEKVLQKAYEEAQKAILADVTETFAKVQEAGGVWSYANQSALTRSKGLFDQINKEIVNLGGKESKLFNQFLTHEYTDQFTRALFTLGQTVTLKGEGAFAMLNPRLVQAALNYPWSGAMFSDRLWLDKERLTKNLRWGLTQSMILGEGIPEITKRIKNGINTSRYNAERIARTETKRVSYTSQATAWETQNIKEVKYMTAGNGTESNICAQCWDDHGKVYKLGEEPSLPRHPNCRCWYVPHVPDTYQPGELNELTNSVRGAEKYEKWMETNKDKLNPDGTLKDGWVRDWKNGGKLIYQPGGLKDDRVFRYNSVDEYEKKISEMDKEIKDLQNQKLATTGVLNGTYTPEEKGYTDLSSVAQIDKDITLKMKALEKDQIDLSYEMKDFQTNPPKPPAPKEPDLDLAKSSSGVTISQRDQMKLTDYPEEFYKTKAEAKNTQAFMDYINGTYGDGADPEVLALYRSMDKLNTFDDNGIVFKISHASSHSVSPTYKFAGMDGRQRRYIASEVKLTIPKVDPKNAEEMAGAVHTTLHEEMHLLDFMCSDSFDYKKGKWFSVGNTELTQVFHSTSADIGDEVKELFAQHEKEYEKIRKELKEKFNQEHEKIKTQFIPNGAFGAGSDYAGYKKAWKKLQKEIESERDLRSRNIMGGGIGNLQDIYDALSGGTHRDTGRVKYGHGIKYYMDKDSRVEETVANYGALSILRPDLVRMLERDKPELVSALQKNVREMLKRAKK